jgi:hypothetical protein
VLALAQALIDHHERTLNAAEIDALIARTLARQALAAEQVRRAAWRRTIENSENFATAFQRVTAFLLGTSHAAATRHQVKPLDEVLWRLG